MKKTKYIQPKVDLVTLLATEILAASGNKPTGVTIAGEKEEADDMFEVLSKKSYSAWDDYDDEEE